MIFKRYLQKSDKSVIIDGLIDDLKMTTKRLLVHLNNVCLENFHAVMDDMRRDYR